MEFKLPPLGEGIETATVTAVLVQPGETVQAGQNVIAVETDKAAVEVPVDQDGVVEAVLVQTGDRLAIGAPVLRLRPVGSPPAASPPSAGPAAAAKPEPSAKLELSAKPESPLARTELAAKSETKARPEPAARSETPAPSESPPGQVAAPVRAGAASEHREAAAVAVAASEHAAPTFNGTAEASETRSMPATLTSPTAPARSAELIPASPATRRLARELGVSLEEVRGSGRGGRVTLDDVKNFVRAERQRIKMGDGSPLAAAAPAIAALASPPLPDFSKYGPIETVDVPTIRQTIARNLTLAWRMVPMVTQHDVADITELETGRKRILAELPPGSPKVTMTVLAIKACVAALKEFPQFNSSFDMANGKLILKRYYHIGIAVDTKDGLVVPVVRDADKKSIRELAQELQQLAEKARARKLAIDDMRGGTFTISNLGGIGGTAFTPIVNYPEVAILGIARSQWQPVVRDGQIVPRLLMPICLTYDHRVIDGADGCRFTTRLVQLLGDPLRLLLET